MRAVQTANDPASVGALPGHGSYNPEQEKAVNKRSNTTAPAVPAIGETEHKAWTDLDDTLTSARNRLDVAFHFAAEMADLRADGFAVRVDHDHLQRFCFMVFEAHDTMQQVEALATAYYRADIAPREAA